MQMKTQLQKNKELLGKANKERNEMQWKYLWTNNGKILAKKSVNSRAILINNERELAKIK